MIDSKVVICQIEDMLSKINKDNLFKFGATIDNGKAFYELMVNVLSLLKNHEQEAEKD